VTSLRWGRFRMRVFRAALSADTTAGYVAAMGVVFECASFVGAEDFVVATIDRPYTRADVRWRQRQATSHVEARPLTNS